ncbi:MAG TPA: glycosyltransferase [Flavobacterium sp.]|jgi:glycosyltransferase involved in cell wall biosynthesis
MLSVVIRNKNEGKELEFLLKNLTLRYASDIDEIIVLDNLSTDNSRKVTEAYGAKFVSIEKFTYGGSANTAAESAKNDIVVLFSAHSFPVSHDFFKLISDKFAGREHELAGLRCLHNAWDFTAYLNGVTTDDDPNKAGLNFAGSVFNKRMWRDHRFKDDIRTFEDKEWTKRMIRNGYKIEFVPSIFCYYTKRTKSQLFFRFKNELIGSYQLHHTEYTLGKALKNFVTSFWFIHKNFAVDLFFLFKRLFFTLKFLMNKPDKFE